MTHFRRLLFACFPLFIWLQPASTFTLTQVRPSKISTASISNGTTYTFKSVWDGTMITVKENGEVVSLDEGDLAHQMWTIGPHPRDVGFLEFKQETVPYNDLSGHEENEYNQGLVPRPLSFAKNGIYWEIRIRTRFCLQANGLGRKLDIDDCEDFFASWQLWELNVVSSTL